MVHENIEEAKISINRRSQQNGLSEILTWRILRKYFDLKAYNNNRMALGLILQMRKLLKDDVMVELFQKSVILIKHRVRGI